MLLIFRKLRHSLIQKNKVTTYLLYALGEIILVVIGILIALEVNNRNEQRKSHDLEIKYLTEIKDNLEIDLIDVNFNIDFNRVRLRANQEVLNYLKEKRVDSLSYHLGNTMFTTRTLVNTSGYESLKSKGLELITNDSLRSNLTRLYEFEVHNLVDFETKDDHAFQYGQLMPEVMAAIDVDYGQFEDASVPIGSAAFLDAQNVRKNFGFKNASATNILYRDLMLTQYLDLRSAMNVTIKFIDEDLKRLK